MHITHPILFSFDSLGDQFIKMRYFDVSSGMSAVLMDAESMQKIHQKLPDS